MMILFCAVCAGEACAVGGVLDAALHENYLDLRLHECVAVELVLLVVSILVFHIFPLRGPFRALLKTLYRPRYWYVLIMV